MGFPSQASDPSRCDVPHRTPPATLSSCQVPQGMHHSSLFAFCTFGSPGIECSFPDSYMSFRLSTLITSSEKPEPLSALQCGALWLLLGEYNSPPSVLVQLLSSMPGSGDRCRLGP